MTYSHDMTNLMLQHEEPLGISLRAVGQAGRMDHIDDLLRLSQHRIHFEFAQQMCPFNCAGVAWT